MLAEAEIIDSIHKAFLQKEALSPKCEPIYKSAVLRTIDLLETGQIRVAEKIEGQWVTNEWVKKAILLYFKLHDSQIIMAGEYQFYDKIAIRFKDFTQEMFQELKIRVVPPAIARVGTYIGPNSVLMAGYVNIGAYIGEGSMIDIWATVGSCAQIGKNCHISSNAVIGGVLEPMQASPVIIEDNCFIGSGAVIAEGVIVEEHSVIGTGTKINQSTKIYDRAQDKVLTGRIPKGSVVIPGSIPSNNGKYNIDCAIIVKTVDQNTRSKVSINELLRD